MRDFLKAMPKAELHLHIEGTFEPELMFAIAQRNGVRLPHDSVDDLRKAYSFSCLQDFLDLYYMGTNVLLYEQDFYDLTMAYLRKCKEENIVHAEIMFDPQSHTERGVSFEVVIMGIVRACEEARKEWGMSTLLIMSYLRHLSEEKAFETLGQSLPYKEYITAVGLDSSELGHPPAKFQKVFRASEKEGFVLLAHAGEEGPAEYIWEALDVLKIARIDHGNRCLEDPTLVQEIIARDMALTLCPLSNLSLKVIDDLKNHPAKRMLDLGINITINSDDPAYFGGYLTQNYTELQEALDLTREDILKMVDNSFQYSLLDRKVKETFSKQLFRYVQQS